MSMPFDMDRARQYAAELLVGERVRLRALAEDDVPALERWWLSNASAIFQTQTFTPAPRGPAGEMFRTWSANDTGTGVGFCVEVIETGQLAGHVTLWGVNSRTRCATVGIILGDEFQDGGLGTDALRVLVRYGFLEMGLHRIELQAVAFNIRGIRTYEKCGFVVEGRSREAVFHDGEFHDEVRMGLLRREWTR